MPPSAPHVPAAADPSGPIKCKLRATQPDMQRVLLKPHQVVSTPLLPATASTARAAPRTSQPGVASQQHATSGTSLPLPAPSAAQHAQRTPQQRCAVSLRGSAGAAPRPQPAVQSRTQTSAGIPLASHPQLATASLHGAGNLPSEAADTLPLQQAARTEQQAGDVQQHCESTQDGHSGPVVLHPPQEKDRMFEGWRKMVGLPPGPSKSTGYVLCEAHSARGAKFVKQVIKVASVCPSEQVCLPVQVRNALLAFVSVLA